MSVPRYVSSGRGSGDMSGAGRLAPEARAGSAGEPDDNACQPARASLDLLYMSTIQA